MVLKVRRVDEPTSDLELRFSRKLYFVKYLDFCGDLVTEFISAKEQIVANLLDPLVELQ